MAVYGVTLYGTETYGYFIPPVYRVDPFTATPTSYSQITVTWTKPAGTVLGYRLVKNMFGAPVDQDDGQVLLDITSGYPGSNFVDNNITPGAYHYYGVYLLINDMTNEWVRAGLTGCLMLSNYNSAQYMQDLIPNFYVNAINAENELVDDPIGNSFLSKFMEVCGWGFDYLRTQYDTYQNVNNPWKVPLNDLYTMAGQFNININPEIHPYTLRKALYNNAIINKLRGTTTGIATELSALTGWNADITIGPNIMLDNDQSYFADPFYPAWSGNITYNIGERVQFGNYFYNCISAGNYGNAPTGTASSNTWWVAIVSSNSSSYLFNSVTGGVSTWETLYPSLTNGTYSLIPDLALVQSVQGVNIPASTISFSSPTTLNNCIVIQILATNGTTVSAVSFGGSSMTLLASFNDTGDGNFDYWYVYYLANAPSGQAFTLTVTGPGQAYGYLYEIQGLGTPSTSWAAEFGGNTSFDSGPATSTGQAFFVGGMMGGGNQFVGGSWNTADAGALGVGGYLFGSGAQDFSGSFGGFTEISVTGIAFLEPSDVPPSPVIYETIGVPDPLSSTTLTFNSVGAKNLYVSTTNLWLRSIARTLIDLETTTTTFAPDKYQAVADGIPIPFIGFNEAWSPVVHYQPQQIVTYNNQPFVALRASLNSVPPYTSVGIANQDWSPLSLDDRFRICVSAYVTASSSVQVYPFAEWYDANGNLITRVISRNPTPGTIAIPNQLVFDSFTVGAGSTLSARETNDGGSTWTADTGSFSVSPFGASGCAYPTVTGQRSIATVNSGNANAQVGLTFVTSHESGQSTGLVLRYTDNNDYLRADMTALKQNSGGTLSTLGTYSTPCQVGDRLLVTLNGTTITCYRNNVQVLQVTSSFNQSSTTFGIVNENV
jgi:hypothetical protein